MKKIIFYKLKYKTKNIFLGYCDYDNFEWCCEKIKGTTVLCINNKYSSKDKRKILHRVIREVS